MDQQLNLLTTESRNSQTINIDTADTSVILRIINEEDKYVALAVQQVLPGVEAAIKFAFESLKKGGRLIYIGAGTSGRIGVLDAVESPPTFSVDPSLVQGIMAGGVNAFTMAVEGAEDKEELGEKDLRDIHLDPRDTVIGIAASGRTPYVIGALIYAQRVGAKTVALSSNENAAISKVADIGIEVVVGPEVLTGSTRLKAATAHKMILNMISTTTMIHLGKAYENLMVDVHVSNFKLKERAVNMIQKITNVSYEKAKEMLESANNEVKTAIVMIETGKDYEKSIKLLEQANGYVRNAIKLSNK